MMKNVRFEDLKVSVKARRKEDIRVKDEEWADTFPVFVLMLMQNIYFAHRGSLNEPNNAFPAGKSKQEKKKENFLSSAGLL
ncbi:uncharacterized protein PHALS_01093 [Plasmopara halstedii]|uniref:Uncharacterized protein n=1 Tax=Plasmopara halstedii TaxID=4781 RepID=A0A0N7L6N3_PLAHL|nr:uncharacterized protein PHALS_01093 [Plasmopara halstedii]CEG44755.1 hypothetical protein PHALS_01093 [Plasmopara halstedii]|eukprot:XP_024581124.1 hypothetical protein PHALS_01093 [Plasmopara halstedii]